MWFESFMSHLIVRSEKIDVCEYVVWVVVVVNIKSESVVTKNSSAV